jgi:UDP-glucose 6-dehydrogenase
MKATDIATGRVVLVTGACLANVGNDALSVDLDVATPADPGHDIVPVRPR